MSILDLIANGGAVSGFIEGNKAIEESKSRKISDLYNTSLLEKNNYALARDKRRDQAAEEIATEADAEKKRSMVNAFSTRFPEEAKRMADATKAMTETELLSESQSAKRQDDYLRAVQSAPPNKRESVYQSMLNKAKTDGDDVTQWPGTYREAEEKGLPSIFMQLNTTRQTLINNRLNEQKVELARQGVVNERARQGLEGQKIKLQERQVKVQEDNQTLDEQKYLNPEGKATGAGIKIGPIPMGVPSKEEVKAATKVTSTLRDDGADNIGAGGLFSPTSSTDNAAVDAKVARVQRIAPSVSGGDMDFTNRAIKATVYSNVAKHGDKYYTENRTAPNYMNRNYMSEFARYMVVDDKGNEQVVFEDYSNLGAASFGEKMRKEYPEDAEFLGTLKTEKLDAKNNAEHASIRKALADRDIPVYSSTDAEAIARRVKAIKQIASGKKDRGASKEALANELERAKQRYK